MLLVVLLLLLFPAGAQARPFDRVDREALALAIEYWGPPPCPQGLTTQVVPDADLARIQPGFEGYASSCKIELGAVTRERSYTMRCLLMVHEVGHIEGHPHSTDLASPMFPDMSRITAPPAVCDRGLWRRVDGCDRKRTRRSTVRCYRRWSIPLSLL